MLLFRYGCVRIPDFYHSNEILHYEPRPNRRLRLIGMCLKKRGGGVVVLIMFPLPSSPLPQGGGGKGSACPPTSGSVQITTVALPWLRDAVRRSQTSRSQIRRFPQRLENLVDQKRTKDCVQKVLYHLTGSFPRGYVVRVRCITTYNHGRGRITTDWYSWQAAYAERDERVV